MIVTANAHIGFNCKDLDRTQKFYEDVLDCREKFSLYYGDLIPEAHPERWAQMQPEEVERLQKLRDVRWIVYLEWPGDKDRFIELFNEVDAHVDNPYRPEHYGYTHFSFVVDDIEAFHRQLIDRGAGDCVDIKPGPSLDGNWTMWFHDPEGIRIEVHQYGPESYQIYGRKDR